MRRALLLSALLVLLPWARDAAADDVDGAFLLRGCNAAVLQSDGKTLSPLDTAYAVRCKYYVGGFLDGMQVGMNIGEPAMNPKICFPPSGIAHDQAMRVLVKYLQVNPSKLHEPGRGSLYVALAGAFPCP